MKKQLRIFAASFVALASLLSSANVPLAAAAPGSDACEWTGGGTDTKWSTVANWTNCSSGAPVSGDSVVFDNSTFTNSLTTTNDIAGLTLLAVALSGTTSNAVTVDGSGFSLSGGTLVTATGGAYLSLDVDQVTLTANQTLNSTYVNGTTNLGSFVVTLNNNSGLYGGLSGSGTVQINSGGVYADEANSGFSGTIIAESGSYVSALLPDGTFGTGSLVIKEGAQLNISSYSASVTFPNNVTVAGNGMLNGDSPGVIAACVAMPQPTGNGGIGSANCPMTAPGTVTLTGKLTLTGNATFAGGLPNPSQDQTTTFIVAGEFVKGDFTLTAANGSKTVIQIGAATTKAKSPTTGIGVIAANPVQTLAITALLGGGIYFLSRRVLAKSAVRR